MIAPSQIPHRRFPPAGSSLAARTEAAAILAVVAGNWSCDPSRAGAVVQTPPCKGYGMHISFGFQPSSPAKAGDPVIARPSLLDAPPEPVIGPAKGRTR